MGKKKKGRVSSFLDSLYTVNMYAIPKNIAYLCKLLLGNLLYRML